MVAAEFHLSLLVPGGPQQPSHCVMSACSVLLISRIEICNSMVLRRFQKNSEEMSRVSSSWYI